MTKVFVKNHQGTPTWLEGIVTGITSPLSYKVKVNDGSVIRRHIDDICIHHSPPQLDNSTEAAIDDSFMFPQHTPQQSPVLRRLTRIKHPPDRFS